MNYDTGKTPAWGNRPNETTLDLWGAINRHLPALIFSVLVCGILGAVYFVTAEKQYESRAEIVVEEKRPPVFNEETARDRPTLQQGVEQHQLVVKSPMVLELASEQAGILELSEFNEINHEDLLDVWDGRFRVSIPDTMANVLELSYRGSNPEECQQIVSGIVDAYGGYLNDKSTGTGIEIMELVKRGKDELLVQLDEKQSEYAEFQRTAKVMWTDGEAVNLHHARQIDLEEKRKALIVDKSLNDAKLVHLLTSLRDGGEEAHEAARYEAMIELRLADDKDQDVEIEAARGYSLELSREYMSLLMEERKMAGQFGAGHPDLKVMRSRLKEMKSALQAALGAEKNGKNGLGKSTDYVEAYKRVLRERSTSMQKQLEMLNASYKKEEVAGSKLTGLLAADERHRSGIESTKSMLDVVVDRLEEINIIQNYGGERMDVIAKPSVAEVVWPSLPIIGALSMMSGLLLGLAWTLLREITNRIFNDPSEIRSLLGVPVLGQIPLVKEADMKVNPDHEEIAPAVKCVHSSQSRFSEAYRGVRTALHFSTNRKDVRIMQVTSPLPGDGKSTVVANLAAASARAGKSVVVIDADLRRPQIYKLFGQSIENGISDVLRGDITVEEAICETSVPNLSVVTSGTPPENPAELLASDEFVQLLSDLRERFDFVLVDGPPLLAVSDPSVLSAQVDGVVLVLRIRKGVRRTAAKAKEILDDVDSNLIGVVVNGVADGRGKKGGYGYDYGYGYGYGYTGSNRYFEDGAKVSKSDERSLVKVHSGESNGHSTNGNGNGNGNGKSSNGNGKGRGKRKRRESVEEER